MRAQAGIMHSLAEQAAEIRQRLAPKPLVFYLGMAFLIIYSFVLTQGVSPDETISGEKIPEKVCDNLVNIAPVTDKRSLYFFEQLCTNFVCRSRPLDMEDLYESEISQMNQIAYLCNVDEDAAFDAFVDHCSNYCAKGFLDVNSVSKTISRQITSVVGEPDYCIFLKKGPMSSVLVPRCTDGIVYNGQQVNLCMKGFSCYLYGPGAPSDTCRCDELYDFKRAADEYEGLTLTVEGVEYSLERPGYEAPTLTTVSYDDYTDDGEWVGYTKFDTVNKNEGKLSCGLSGYSNIVFKAEDPAQLEWWFRYKAFPTETSDPGWNSFITNKFPKPICIVTFGLLPFAVIFFLLKDTIMYFVPIQEDLKQLSSVFIALLSLLFGTFDNVVLLISKLAGWSLSFSFVVCVFGVAIFGSISNIVMMQMLQRRQANERLIRFAASLGELSE